VGNLTDQFTTMSMDVDQEHICSDRLEEQVGRLEEELDAEWSVCVQLTVDLRRALDMCNSWADRAIELRRDVNMLRARIEPIPSSSSSEDSGSSSVDAIEDGAVAGDHGVYHVGLEFDLLSPEAITLHRQQLRAAWQAAMDGEGRVVQIGGPVDEPPPPDYDFCPQGYGGVNWLALIEDEMGGEALNNIEEIQEAGGPTPDYNNHCADPFITPLPCARCASRRRVENGPNGWGDNYVDE